jgi:large subunit ribosomal protein L9
MSKRKVEVLLIQHVVGLGAEADHVKVAPGYARNYLLPQRLAVPLNAANKRRIEVLRQRRAEREAQELNAMNELAKSLSKMTLTIPVKTGDDGKMHGAVTNGAIADELKTQFEIPLDKRKIHLDKPIKQLGEFDVPLNLHPDVKTTFKVVVVSSTPQPVVAAPAAHPNDASGKPQEGGRPDRGDRRGPRPDRGERRPRREAEAAPAPAKA